ncbi:MAG: DUF1015 domain-containing protein, partial [Phycisphaerae bacterium]
MAQIRPFRAIRYPDRDISNRIAPPYDVLDRADKQALLARNDRNIVAIDLPHVPPKQAGPPETYEHAAMLLRQWLADGALRQDEHPALYVYHQTFAHGGRTYTRRKFFARLRIEEFGAGSVYPHEQTFGGPKADRLMLTRATRCNLSPIFTLFPDETNDVAGAFETAIKREPDAAGTLDGVESRLWAVTDAAVIDRVCGLLADRSVFIADGHHRYGTAVMYRDELAKSQGGLPDDHPANFVLCVLAGMEEPGLLILPTHRVVCDLPDASSALLAEALAD